MSKQCKIACKLLSYSRIQASFMLFNFPFRELTKNVEILTISIKSLFGHTMIVVKSPHDNINGRIILVSSPHAELLVKHHT